jgi:hypothetical protein
MQKVSGQNMSELKRVGSDGRLGQRSATSGDDVLQSAAYFATDGGRESGDERLVFGHA